MKPTTEPDDPAPMRDTGYQPPRPDAVAFLKRLEHHAVHLQENPRVALAQATLAFAPEGAAWHLRIAYQVVEHGSAGDAIEDGIAIERLRSRIATERSGDRGSFSWEGLCAVMRWEQRYDTPREDRASVSRSTRKEIEQCTPLPTCRHLSKPS